MLMRLDTWSCVNLRHGELRPLQVSRLYLESSSADCLTEFFETHIRAPLQIQVQGRDCFGG